MASMIKNGMLLNVADQARAPQKDYCQLLISTDQVTFRWWKISLRQSARSYPGEIKDSHEDFLHDEKCHSEILRCFGRNMLNYAINLAEGKIDYLPRLPKDLLIRILSMVDLETLTNMASLNKQFRKLCNSEQLWEQIYRDHSKTPVTEDLISLAEGFGWKRLFFTNKLQLQVQLSRQMRGKCTVQDSDSSEGDNQNMAEISEED